MHDGYTSPLHLSFIPLYFCSVLTYSLLYTSPLHFSSTPFHFLFHATPYSLLHTYSPNPLPLPHFPAPSPSKKNTTTLALPFAVRGTVSATEETLTWDRTAEATQPTTGVKKCRVQKPSGSEASGHPPSFIYSAASSKTFSSHLPLLSRCFPLVARSCPPPF